MAGALSAVDMQYLAGDEGGAFEIEHRIDDIARSRPCARPDAVAARNSWVSGLCIGVLITPGDTALTRTPFFAYSIASDLVAAFNPPLVSDASTDGTLLLA